MKLAKLQAVRAFRSIVQAQAEKGNDLTHEFTLGSILGISAMIFEIYGEQAAEAAAEEMFTALKRSQGPE